MAGHLRTGRVSQDDGARAELGRVRRVADMLCTAHAGLADDYTWRALVFDIALLVLSGWVASLAFVDPRISLFLVPPGLTPTIWIGLMGTAAFVLTLVQMRLDLRGRADAHRRAFDAYAEVKRDAGQILATGGQPDPTAVSRVLTHYGFAASLGVGIPEAEFLRRKQLHLLKVRVSRHLDEYPSASLPLLRIRMWWMDNVGVLRPRSAAPQPEGTREPQTSSDNSRK